MGTQLAFACGLIALFGPILLAPPAVAQDAKRPEASASNAPAPATSPASAFADYQPFREQPLRSWKDANREVAENPGMGSMGPMSNMPGMKMPAGTSNSDTAAGRKVGAAGHNMGSMPGMDPAAGASPKAKAGGAGHDMASMPGMDSKSGAPPKQKMGAAAHDMTSMPAMSPKSGTSPKQKAEGTGHEMASMSGMGSKSGAAPPKGKTGAAGHDMTSMPAMNPKPGASRQGKAGGPGHDTDSMPGMDSKPDQPLKEKGGHSGHDAGAMQGMNPKSGAVQTAGITGTGVVRVVDQPRGKVKLTHDPIASMGWPKMTLFFRLKDNSLAEGVRQGDPVAFSLENSPSGLVISDLQKRTMTDDNKQNK